MEIKTKDVINVYKKIFDPLGYMITAKEGKTTPEWAPVDKDVYDSMDTIALMKEIAELKIQEENLNKLIIEVRKKAIDYMNSRQPNTLTENLYTGQYAKNAVEVSKVHVVSQTQQDVKRLLNYLDTLKGKKQQEEMQTDFQKEEAGLISMSVEQGIGKPQTLEVVVK